MKRAGGVCSCVVFVALVLATAGPGLAADGGFIKFEGIDGESRDRDHRNWCDLVSFNHSIHQSEALGSRGTSRRRGTVEVEDLVVVKKLDKASPKLEDAVARGRAIPKVEIHVVSNGRTYYEYELTNVMVSSYSISVPEPSSEPPVEEVSLQFEEIKVTYSEFDETGRLVGKVEFEWSADNSPR